MKRINKKLVEALDKLIAKYSGEELVYKIGYMGCPLCDLFFKEYSSMGKGCTKCPNTYFGENMGCSNRAELYEKLDYLIRTRKSNYPTLKQFWTDYKSLYLQRKYSNSEIMEILITPFKEEQK